MKKIRNFTDVEHQLELVDVQRGVNLEKLKGGIQHAKSSALPSLFAVSLKSILKKKKKKKKKEK